MGFQRLLSNSPLGVTPARLAGLIEKKIAVKSAFGALLICKGGRYIATQIDLTPRGLSTSVQISILQANNILVVLTNSTYCMRRVAQRPALDFGRMWIKKDKKYTQKPLLRVQLRQAWVQVACITRLFVPMRPSGRQEFWFTTPRGINYERQMRCGVTRSSLGLQPFSTKDYDIRI